MFDLYHAPDTAAQRQSDLLGEIAADRLARAANEDQSSSTNDRVSTGRSLARRAGDVVAAINGAISSAFHLGGSHARYS